VQLRKAQEYRIANWRMDRRATSDRIYLSKPSVSRIEAAHDPQEHRPELAAETERRPIAGMPNFHFLRDK